MPNYRKVEEDIFGRKIRVGLNSRVKGNLNERACAKSLEYWVGEEFTRVPSSGGLRWKNSQGVSGDVMCTKPDFYFPFSVETKHLVKLTVRKVLKIWEQVEADAIRSDKIPIAFLRQNVLTGTLMCPDKKRRQDYYVIMDARYGGITLNLKVDTVQEIENEETGLHLMVFRFSTVWQTLPYAKFAEAIKKGNFVEKMKSNNGKLNT